MFLAERPRRSRLLSVGLASALVAAATVVAAAPSRAEEVYLRPADSTVVLSGRGYGHGLGMSQWGAYGAAKVGKLSWQSILAYSYPGTTLVNFGNPTIRVRLDAVGRGPLYLPTPAGLRLAGKLLPATTIAGAPITRYRASSRAAGGLQVDGLSATGWKLYAYSAGAAVFSNPLRGDLVDVLLVNGTKRTYRGSLVANRVTATSLSSVSVLPMESYLSAVVPAEMPASWHPNALAAQAVAARSYANFDRSRTPAGRTWDTCDTTSCQMYSGLSAELATSSAAVVATAGQTLTFGGKPAFTQFGAANGGWSAAGSQPYLVARSDPYDGAIPNGANSWTKKITVASIQARWPSIGTYQKLRIITRDGNGPWGGRVLTAAIDGTAGSVAVSGATIRSAFGLMSEWFVPTNPRFAPSYPHDFSGDGKPDVLAVVAGTGTLRMYAGNGASGWKSMSVIGTGFGAFSKVFTAGPWDRDAISDVMAQKPDGTLWLFSGTPGGQLGPPRQIGSGWGIYNLIIPAGDFDGDGPSDLVARRPDGTLVLYSGNGSGGFLKNAQRIGSGWGSFNFLFSPGDFNGDRRTDIITRTSGGLLYLYPGNGSGGWLRPRLISQGWSTISTITSSGDLDSDGKSDILGRARDGTLWMYPGNGAGGLLGKKPVGAGWNMFSTVLR